MAPTTTQKSQAAEQALARLDGVVVALSGGVDSSLLLALAIRALGPDKVLAVTAGGPVEADEDLTSAKAVADIVGARHRSIYLDPLELPEFPLNTPMRCYVCRRVNSTQPWKSCASRPASRPSLTAR